MATTLPLDKMTADDKIQAMELLWDELCKKAGGVVSPEWHGEILTERKAIQKAGKDKFEDWEVVKVTIRNRLSLAQLD